MRNIIGGLVAAVLTGGMLGGCTHYRAAQDLALDYNVAFAKSRDEMILQNILRAAAREPLQFSTMSGLTGTFSTNGAIEIPFNNLIAGGKNAISPTLSLGGGASPSITITPLASREFTNGILKPIAPETINLLRGQGFDLEFLLPLVIGGVICPDTGQLIMNTGNFANTRGGTPTYELFRTMFAASAPAFSLKQIKTTVPVEGSFSMASEEAMRTLREGVGKDYAIRAIRPGRGATARVELQSETTDWTVANMQYEAVCKPPADKPEQARYVTRGAVLQNSTFVSNPEAGARKDRSSVAKAIQGGIMLRSVESIIYFLGESHRYRFNREAVAAAAPGLTYFSEDRNIRTLFRLDWGAARTPAAVSTRFHDTRFFVPRVDLRDADLRRTAYDNRTMKTLSLLNELIALQTSESTIEASRPIIAVGR